MLSRKTLVTLDRDWKLYKEGKVYPPEDGIYLTIRAGYSGIYEMINEWKNGEWQGRVLDGSFTLYWETTKLNPDEIFSNS